MRCVPSRAWWFVLPFLATAGRSQIAKDCLDYGQYCRWIGGAPVYDDDPYPSYLGYLDLAVAGDLVYLIRSDDDLQVVDLSVPDQPQDRGVLPLFGSGWSIACHGDHFYLGRYDIILVGTVDATGPAVVDTLSTPGSVFDLAVHTDRLLVAAGATGLTLLDPEEPDTPTMLPLSGSARRVAASGNLAVVGTCDPDRLYVIDLSDPAAPVVLGSLDLAAEVTHTQIDGELAIVMLATEVAQLVDVADPSTPETVHTFAPPQLMLRTVGLHAGVAYLSGCSWQHEGGALLRYDLAVPSEPALIGRDATLSRASEMRFLGDRLYMAEVGEYDCASDYAGLDVYDIAHPESPPPTANLPVPNWYRGFCVSGHMAYLSLYLNGLKIVDLSDPAEPLWRGHYDADDGFKFDFTVGNEQTVFAFGSRSDPGPIDVLRAVDVSDPDAPVAVASIDTEDECLDLALASDALYFCGWDGLWVFDVTVPADLHLQSFRDDWGRIGDCDAEGTLVALIDDWQNLVLIDATNPAALVELAVVADPPQRRWSEVDLSGDLAVVSFYDPTADGPFYYPGCQLVDVADPTQPQLLGICLLPTYERCEAYGGSEWMAIRGSILYVAGIYGTYLFDVSDPTAPIRVGQIPLDTFCLGFVGDHVVTKTGEYLRTTPRHCSSLTAIGDPVPAAPLALRVWPNPANPRLELSFSLARTARVRLDVYDPKGRLVCRLSDGRYEAGHHSVSWDGYDDDGRPVQSGVYLARLVAAGEVTTAKLTLVR